jgi:hypothetical protein
MTAHSWRPVNLAALGNEPPPVATLSGVLYPGCIALLYAEPEGLKSWLALVLGLTEIRAGGCALLLDYEMSAPSIRARLVDLGATDEELERFLYIAPAEPLKDPHVISDVATLIDAHKPSLVIVDALAGAMALSGLDGNSGADVETFYGSLAPFRSRGAAVACIDHVVKSLETRGRWPIGSQRKLGAVDVGISLEVVSAFSRGHTGLARLRVRKDRLGSLPRPFAAELELVSDPDTGRITWSIRPSEHTDGESGDAFRPTILMERVFSYLKEQSEPVTRNSIAAGVKGTKQWVLKAVDELVAEGSAEEVPGPRNSKLVSLAVCGSEPVPEPHEPLRGTEPVPVLLSTRTRTTNQSEKQAGEDDAIPF